MQTIARAISGATFALIAGGRPAHAACYGEGAKVTLEGRLVLAKANSVRDDAPHVYPLLQLSRPICYADKIYGDVPSAKAVAIAGTPRVRCCGINPDGRSVAAAEHRLHAGRISRPHQGVNEKTVPCMEPPLRA